MRDRMHRYRASDPSPKAIPAAAGLEAEFRANVDKWRTDTRHVSSITRMVAHPSYLRVIGM
jgi:hypothetical protein